MSHTIELTLRLQIKRFYGDNGNKIALFFGNFYKCCRFDDFYKIQGH